ncbi:MAG: molecular chaperone TorD family protein [Myxococcota bacterium]|nr:molecular chaperone TorD family protein [Myxococcota bacterium]
MPDSVARGERALARAYQLLADCFAGPLDASLLQRAEKSPLLRDALTDATDLDQLAADHHLAFDWAVFPQQGVFLDPKGWADGESSDDLRELFGTLGYTARPNLPTDHLSNLLGALHWTLSRSTPAPLAQLQLLDGHLLRWLPAFVAAVCRLGLRLPTALVLQLEDLVFYHRQVLESLGSQVPDFELPAFPPLLEDPGTGLAQIAAFLVSSARSGIFLSREDIAGVVRESDSLRGFGDRRGMLLDALRSASHRETLPRLIEGLTSLHLDWEATLADGVESGLPAQVAEVWTARSIQTRGMLEVLARAGVAADGASGSETTTGPPP